MRIQKYLSILKIISYQELMEVTHTKRTMEDIHGIDIHRFSSNAFMDQILSPIDQGGSLFYRDIKNKFS